MGRCRDFTASKLRQLWQDSLQAPVRVEALTTVVFGCLLDGREACGVEGHQPGWGGGQLDPSRRLKEDGAGLQRPQNWS